MFTLKTHLFLPLSISLVLGSASFAETVQGDKDTTATKQTDMSAEDRALSQDVGTALRADPKLLSAINLSVHADDGEVTLAGSVKNAEQAARAVEIAGNVEGVTNVEDKMVRAKALGMPATPHQSTTVDAPLGEKARPEGTRSE